MKIRANPKISKSDLNVLAQSVYDKFGDFNRGGCGVFAKIMDEFLDTNSFLYIFDEDELEDDSPVHVMLDLG